MRSPCPAAATAVGDGAPIFTPAADSDGAPAADILGDAALASSQNPLMLTMMLSVFKQRDGSLPENRSELYRDALRAMLERADTAFKGGHGALELEPCLQRVA